MRIHVLRCCFAFFCTSFSIERGREGHIFGVYVSLYSVLFANQNLMLCDVTQRKQYLTGNACRYIYTGYIFVQLYTFG